MALTDSHCHLNFPGLRDKLDDVLACMHELGVSRAVNICTQIEEFDDVLACAEQHPHIWATVGVHPDQEGLIEPSVEELAQRARHPRVVAIGETGLDYYRLEGRTVADMEWQRERFRAHIKAAREVGKPLVIHTRAAAEDTLAILKEQGADTVGGVFHCFTETWEVARRALDLGFYISLSGILTFKNADHLREIAKKLPEDRILVETDSPYLAPVPYRGKTNQPGYTRYVARCLAELRGCSEQDVEAFTEENFARLFKQIRATAN
ncbi:MAG: TatD family hydrolase [Betaproteobacteria bacterium]|nr:TatD family hydrolase [Betaproteobacteria bacterium]